MNHDIWGLMTAQPWARANPTGSAAGATEIRQPSGVLPHSAAKRCMVIWGKIPLTKQPSLYPEESENST
jgi:hypothetical protein